jgi:hypothetical protein
MDLHVDALPMREELESLPERGAQQGLSHTLELDPLSLSQKVRKFRDNGGIQMVSRWHRSITMMADDALQVAKGRRL